MNVHEQSIAEHCVATGVKKNVGGFDIGVEISKIMQNR